MKLFQVTCDYDANIHGYVWAKTTTEAARIMRDCSDGDFEHCSVKEVATPLVPTVVFINQN